MHKHLQSNDNRMRYIYYINRSFPAKEKMAENKLYVGVVRVCICVWTCRYTCSIYPQVKILLSFFSAFCFEVWSERVEIQNSRHNVVSLRSEIHEIFLIICLSIYPNSNVPQTSLKPRNSSLERDDSGTPAYQSASSGVHDLTDYPISVSSPRRSKQIRFIDFESTYTSRWLPEHFQFTSQKKENTRKLFFLIT